MTTNEQINGGAAITTEEGPKLDQRRENIRKLSLDFVKSFIKKICSKLKVTVLRQDELNDFMWRVGKLLTRIETEKHLSVAKQDVAFNAGLKVLFDTIHNK